MNLKELARKAVSTLFLSMLCLVAFAQGHQVSGIVKDATGESLIGANVLVKGTTNGAITDFEGKFSLSDVKSSDILVFSYIGCVTQEIKVGNQTQFDVTLNDDSQALEEVVVIGYGTVKRKDLTGSVTSVGADKLAAVPVASATEALTGKMAGVQITTTEGSPDAEMRIRVRGGGSITGDNTPLFIVDGFPVETISDIPASDIEDMTVLKDASSTAIYGSRGANGVILVTTKSGKEGKLSVTYNAYYSIKKIAKTLDVLSPYDYAKWQYELAGLIKENDMSSYIDYFGNYQDMDMYQNISGNDWQDQTFGRTGHAFNQSLNINGGSDKIKYAFGYSHMNDKAIMQGSSFKRDNFSLKLNSKPVKNVTLDFSVRYSDTDVKGGGANDTSSTYDSDKRLKYSVIYTPIPLENLNSESGSSDDDLGNLYHPLTAISDNDRERERKNLNMAGSFTWEIFKNFRAKTEFGYDDYREEDSRFWGLTTYYIKNVPAKDNQGKPAMEIANTFRHKFRNTNTVNYDFEKLLKNDDHHLNAMIGHEWIVTKSKKLTNTVHGFPESFTSQDAWKYSTQGTPYSIDNYLNPDDKLLSFFGRINYDYKSKYLLSATFRADGSSKFSDGNRWGYFPSAAVAWRVSSEPFMEGTKSWLDDLKLRFSYGTAGNNNIPSGQMNLNYASSSTSWINGFNNYWAASKTMPNPDLKWETTITRNIGLDFTTLGGRLSGTLEAYLNTTKDLLIQFPVAGTGYDYQYRNMGKTQNTGFEASVNWIAVDKKNFGLSFSANIGFNKNKIKDLGIMDDFGAETYWASSEIGNDFWIAKGGAVGKMFGYRSAGRYEVSDFEGYDAAAKKWILKEGVVDASAVVGTLRPGMMKLADIDGSGDGKVTTADREIIGDANPVHTGGFSINARAYGFDLSANFNWSVGNDVYNANKIEFTQTSKYQYRNMISEMADGKRWTNLNENGTICNDPEKLAAMNANTTMWSPYTQRMIFSDWAVEDASFLRLNTLTLGYTLPATLLNKVGIQNLRFYVTGYNLFCWTNYSGYDPEVSTIRKTNLTPGVDYSAYPKSRQFVVGLNLNF
ncbi:SusC/RagA family TonB-linked outer membrane protein [uncultured Phocaeicola sp.]|jgi:TonB-linked SusC/RagA family outer membrane protein|uniref:SusC/RagA family TonB-linked outer membrane protein n=2 Tax=uncultured Phocaeicola sp. TaxID=990718 RepID=UPI003526E82C